MADPGRALQAFHESIRDCRKCPLATSRTQVVCGSGDPQAEVMFVGEAPGAAEDRRGVPFVGAAGRLLDRLLREIGLRREEVFITNAVKCRPPQNRTPRADEIAACKPYLQRQIDLIRPRVICTLGNVATQDVLDTKVGIMKVRGQAFPMGDSVVFPMLHPAAALHREALQTVIREDFQRLRAFLDRGPPEPGTDAPTL